MNESLALYEHQKAHVQVQSHTSSTRKTTSEKYFHLATRQGVSNKEIVPKFKICKILAENEKSLDIKWMVNVWRNKA